jgi:hypothetical protein
MNRHEKSHHDRWHHRPRGDARRADRGKGRPSRATFRRRFFTREERIAGLEQYLNELRAEAQAVEEKLARLTAAS